MIIRSQNRKEIHVLSNIKMIKVVTNSQEFMVEVNSQHAIGTYSTEEKAIKVLDMIQEAYCAMKASECISMGNFNILMQMPKKDRDENVRTYKGMYIFQMPEDSEV